MTADASDYLCQLFKKQSHWVWKRLGQALSRKFMFSETTITELLLLELAEKAPSIVTVVPFKPAEERKNGADWQWCFTDQSTSLFAEARIQAKRIYSKGRYANLLHKYNSGSPIFQMNRLIDEAAKAQVPPLYVFYNHLQPKHAKYVSHGGEPAGLWGCSFANADDVKRCIRPTARGYSGSSFSSIVRVSRPWHELVCPTSVETQGQDQSLPERVAAVIRGEIETSLPSATVSPTERDERVVLVDDTHLARTSLEISEDAETGERALTELPTEDDLGLTSEDLFNEIVGTSVTKEYRPSKKAPTYLKMLSAEHSRDPRTGFVELPSDNLLQLQSEHPNVPGAVIVREPGSK